MMILDEMLNAYFRTPPFTNQLGNAAEVARMERELAELRAGLSPAVLEEASGSYDRAISRSPQDWWLRWKYAQLLYLGRGRAREALEQFEAVTRLVPYSFLGWSGMGFIHHKLGDADAAVASCLTALEAAPTKAEVHNTLGAAYSLKGAADKAEEHFKKAVTLQPHYTAAHVNLSYLYAEGGRLDEAVRAGRRGLAFEPGSAELVLALADHLVRSGAADEAISELKNAQQRDPRNEALNRKLNELLWEKAVQKTP